MTINFEQFSGGLSEVRKFDIIGRRRQGNLNELSQGINGVVVDAVAASTKENEKPSFYGETNTGPETTIAPDPHKGPDTIA